MERVRVAYFVSLLLLALLFISGPPLILHFCRRTPTLIYVRESHVEKMGKVQDIPYEILNVLEFNRSLDFLTYNICCLHDAMRFDCYPYFCIQYEKASVCCMSLS